MVDFAMPDSSNRQWSAVLDRENNGVGADETQVVSLLYLSLKYHKDSSCRVLVRLYGLAPLRSSAGALRAGGVAAEQQGEGIVRAEPLRTPRARSRVTDVA
eukprot:COSAG02_NODE_801_length_17030_cov_150.308428_17_plen_101_part_00